MSYRPEQFDAFFAPFVGNQDTADKLQLQLTQVVADSVNPDSDPYARLRSMLDESLTQASVGTVDQTVSLEKLLKDTDDAATIDDFSKFAVHGLLTRLERVGNIYVDKAKVPQHPDNIERVTTATADRWYRAAFIGGPAARKMLLYDRHATSVTSKAVSPDHNFYLAPPGSVTQEAYDVIVDEEGQLDIRPKFPLPRGNGNVCPATYAKVEGGSALWAFWAIVTKVVAKEVYPQFIAIKNDPALPRSAVMTQRAQVTGGKSRWAEAWVNFINWHS